MSRWLIVSMPVFFGVLMLAPSVRAGSLVQFDGGIGVIPVVAGGGANTVRGVSPAGNPWVIEDFKAKVKENGEIKADGKGLVLAGGNSIGTPDGVTMVAATLFCQTSAGPPAATFSAHSSGAHPLAADGDFKIRDTLSPTPPDPCTNPALLIRATNSTGVWLAAGIPKVDD